MKKILKKVNKTIKNTTETLVNVADIVMLDILVENLLKKIKNQIITYNYTTIGSKDELNIIFNEWKNEIFDEYDEKVGISDEEKSNISIRRRNLRRGLDVKLELFYKTYEKFLIHSKEISEELSLIDDLITQEINELVSNESSFVNDTPDAIEIKYNQLKNNQLNSFHLKLSQLTFVVLEQEVIDAKKESAAEKFDECVSRFLEQRQQVSFIIVFIFIFFYYY